MPTPSPGQARNGGLAFPLTLAMPGLEDEFTETTKQAWETDGELTAEERFEAADDAEHLWQAMAEAVEAMQKACEQRLAELEARPDGGENQKKYLGHAEHVTGALANACANAARFARFSQHLANCTARNLHAGLPADADPLS